MGWSWLFNWGSSPIQLPGEYDVPQSEEIPELPHDFDSYEWWNPMDWFGNYDKSDDAYQQRKREQYRMWGAFYIIAGLIGFWIYKK